MFSPTPNVTIRLITTSMESESATAWTGLSASSGVIAATHRRTDGSNSTSPTNDGAQMPNASNGSDANAIAFGIAARMSGCIRIISAASCSSPPPMTPRP